MSVRRERQKGNAAVEAALVFLPLILTVFSTMEVTRGMWMYHTLTSAIKSGARYTALHGQNCVEAATSCAVTVGDISSVIKKSGVGLDADHLQLTLTANGSTHSCATLATCLSDQTAWPPANHNAPGLSVTIEGSYSFQSVVSILWPGQVSSFTYLGKATEIIQF